MVTYGNAEVLYYENQVVQQPSVLPGCPVAARWRCFVIQVFTLDDFDKNRQRRQLCRLSTAEGDKRLQSIWGYKAREIPFALKSTKLAKTSAKNPGPFEKMGEIKESLSHRLLQDNSRKRELTKYCKEIDQRRILLLKNPLNKRYSLLFFATTTSESSSMKIICYAI
jgi:hypothetical protein